MLRKHTRTHTPHTQTGPNLAENIAKSRGNRERGGEEERERSAAQAGNVNENGSTLRLQKN